MKTTENTKIGSKLMTANQCQFCKRIFDDNVFYQCPRCENIES